MRPSHAPAPINLGTIRYNLREYKAAGAAALVDVREARSGGSVGEPCEGTGKEDSEYGEAVDCEPARAASSGGRVVPLPPWGVPLPKMFICK
jgi:hypothetical protein